MSFPCLTTSWDDGHPLDFRIADLLSKYGLSGTFYIPRRCTNETMTEAQLRELSRYFEIGAHTLHHVYLNSCGTQTAEEEISGSRQWVEHVTSQPCKMFCPPGGKFTDRNLAMIAAAGFEAVRTVEMISVAKPIKPKLPGHGSLLIMPTSVQAHPHSPAVYIRNILKRRGRNLVLYLTKGHSPDWPTLAESLMQAAIARGGVFHLWGHSWEIEAAGQWEPLERVFRSMSQLLSQAPCLTNSQVIAQTRNSR